MMHLFLLPLGLISCWFLSKYLNFNLVLASGFSTLLFSLIPIPKVSKSNRLKYDSAFFCGTFVGMGDIGSYISGPLHLTLLSVVGVLVYYFLSKVWFGLGGKLGTIAFITFSLIGMGLGLWR